MTIFLILTALFVVALLFREHQMQTEREAWARERGLLLNRIKPEAAQYVDMPDTPDLQAVPSDDTPEADDDFWLNLERASGFADPNR